jgi:hypothetical protein
MLRREGRPLQLPLDPLGSWRGRPSLLSISMTLKNCNIWPVVCDCPSRVSAAAAAAPSAAAAAPSAAAAAPSAAAAAPSAAAEKVPILGRFRV